MASAPTYTPIATQTLGSATATITFSSIPQTYTDLIVVASVQSGGASQMNLTFNGDTGNNYSKTALYGNGSSALSLRGTNNPAITVAFTDSSPNYSPSIIQIMNYANTTTYKSVLIRTSYSGEVDAAVGLWRGNTGSAAQAITSITLANGSNYSSSSTFTLYGIASA